MRVYFATEDLSDELPAAGFYRGTVTEARLCLSCNTTGDISTDHLELSSAKEH